MANKIELTGNLVKEIRKTEKAAFATIAINGAKDSVTYVDLMLVGKDNVKHAEELKKGDFVKVKAFFTNYKDKDNNTKLGILANEIQKLEKKDELDEARAEVKAEAEAQQEQLKDTPEWMNALLEP